MSSRPPSPPPIYPRSSQAPTSSMAETHPLQTSPYGVYHPFQGYHHGPRLPPPPHISIPPAALNRPSLYRFSPLLPAPHPPTSYSPDRWTQTPIERLTSNKIHTPPGPGPVYSPYAPSLFDPHPEHGPRPPPRIVERDVPPDNNRYVTIYF